MADDPSTGGTQTPTLIAGRYELGDVLGRGSMGTVYRARDTVLDRDVALKLFPSAAADPEQVARFEQEARVLARLSHPGLVTVFDAGIDGAASDQPKPYLVMQLVGGQTLADRVRHGPLPLPEIAELAGRLAPALDHIHRQGIVHRDIKPANVMLDVPSEPGGVASATLTDFGIARLVDGTRITSTGLTIGTANYLSPEQVSGSAVGAPSDIYSLGLVLLECITGEVAYPGYGIEAALPRLRRPPTIPDAVPPAWKQLLSAMTDLDPAARPSAADVAAAVTGLVSGATTRLPETRVLPVAARHVAWRRWLVLGALLAAAAIVAVLAAALSSNHTRMPSTPAYASVPGALGSDLRHLEQAVAPQGMSGAASAKLQADVLTLSRAAAARDWPAAQRSLVQLRRDVAASIATGELSAGRAEPIQASAAAVARDLARKLAAASSARATPTPSQPAHTPVQSHPAPHPKPPKPPKHKHHGDHGHGGDGGGD